MAKTIIMDYKERASAVGKIMSEAKGVTITEKQLNTLNDLLTKVKLTDKQAETRDYLIEKRDKKPELSKTAKARVQERFLEDQYDMKQVFWSKYTDKGNIQEGESITLMSRVLGLFNTVKNEKSFSNDHFTGTPDVLIEDYVIDVKTSWNGFTFPFWEDKIPNMDYYYQLQCYMHLTGKRKAKLVYCLVNTPEEMIEDEIRRQAWQHKIIDVNESFETYVRNQMIFDHVPEEIRVKEFSFDYDENTVKKMIERVDLCGEYYDQLKEQINKNLTINN